MINIRFYRNCAMLTIGAGFAAFAQVTSVPEGTTVARGQVWLPNGASISAAELYASGSSLRTVADLPYSAVQICEYKGDVVQQSKLYRDRAGRTRAETTIVPEGETAEGL